MLIAAWSLTLSAIVLAQDIAVTDLGRVDPFEVGVNPVLPDTVWSSGHADTLRAVFSRLPDPHDTGWTHASAARLALQALQSSGAPPRATEDTFALAALRADQVLSAGGAPMAYALLERTPRVNESDRLTRVFVESAFAIGRTSDACRASDALLAGRGATYWLRVRAVCLALDGAIAAAELTAELARLQSPDPGFDVLFNVYTLDGPLETVPAPRNVLELALMTALAPGAQITLSEEAPPWLHTAAARTAPIAELSPIVSEALEVAVSLWGVDRERALDQLIRQDFDREIAAEALAIRLSESAEAGRFVEISRLHGPELGRLPVTGDTLAHGARFVLAALAADDVSVAERWREALLNGPPAPEPVVQSPPAFVTLPGPAALIPPSDAQTPPEQVEWVQPDPGVLVALDFARAIALGQINDDAFMALLVARIEKATPERLCQAAGLVALGADDQGQLLEALSGSIPARNALSPPVYGPLMLAAGRQALGETQLLAAALLERHHDDAGACATAMLALDHVGLRASALTYLLERVIEDAA